MGVGTFCSVNKLRYMWARGNFALLQSFLYVSMGIFCTTKKPITYGHGDILRCKKAACIWIGIGIFCTAQKPSTRMGHFVSPKGFLGMRMETFCIAKKSPVYGPE